MFVVSGSQCTHDFWGKWNRFPTRNCICEHFMIATNVTESSMNAGRNLQTPLGTFAIWKKSGLYCWFVLHSCCSGIGVLSKAVILIVLLSCAMVCLFPMLYSIPVTQSSDTYRSTVVCHGLSLPHALFYPSYPKQWYLSFYCRVPWSVSSPCFILSQLPKAVILIVLLSCAMVCLFPVFCWP